MLTEGAFRAWSHRLDLCEAAVAAIVAIRAAPPSRRVHAANGNAPTRYVSYKMGWVVATESRTVELPFARAADADETVLEYYDQPGPIWLQYLSPTGRKLPAVAHTPDYFVLTCDGAEWVECKKEEDLVRLEAHNPHRYCRGTDDRWRCPPGERYAERLGLRYRVFSSSEIEWIYQRNLIFLDSYVRRVAQLTVPDDAVACALALLQAEPGLPLAELLRRATGASSDDIYALIAARRIHVDLRLAPLAEPDRVRVFHDASMARAYAAAGALPASAVVGTGAAPIRVGASIDWDGTLWRIVNVGDAGIALLGEDGVVVNLPHANVQTLVARGMIVGVPEQMVVGREEEARDLLLAASPAARDEATRRSRLVLAHRNGERLPGDTTPERTLYHWGRQWRAAQERYGPRFAIVGLLPQVHRRGNRQAKMPPEVRELADAFIAHKLETLKGGTKRAIWGALCRACEERGLEPPSYTTFWRLVRCRPRHQQRVKTLGPRAAYAHEPFYYELTLTTPRHGDRPWEIGHIDHSPGDVELVCPRTGKNLGTCWITLLVDAFSRRILAVYVAFHPPSALSCMMILRECVRRYNRLPETVVVDGGPEFRSAAFERLLARYETHIRQRPGGKPRHGAVCECLFGTSATQLIHSLQGNTKVRRYVRQVTKGVDPRRHACWTLTAFYHHLCGWAYDVYDTTAHPTLGQSPRAAYAQGLDSGGRREHVLIPYDDDFILETLPTTRKGTARVQVSRGVKINNIYYWTMGDEFRDALVEGTQVPVRYDPFDAGRAYAYVCNRWRACISEHYTRFEGRSIVEVMLASAEVRRRHACHNARATYQMSARQIADHLAMAESVEAELLRLRTAENKGILAVVRGHDSHTAGLCAREATEGVSPSRADQDMACAGEVEIAGRGTGAHPLDDGELCEEYV